MPKATMPMLAALVLLSGCASGGASPAPAPDETPADAAAPAGQPSGELTARTFVLDDGEGAELCLSGYGQSFPPTCDGPAIHGWSWDDVDDEENAADTTWGHYEVFGTWDGNSFTLTRVPEPYDPQAPTTPRPAPTPGGSADAPAIARAIEDYNRLAGTPTGVLSLGEYMGRAYVGVIFDDGTLQAEADTTYGKDVVEIYSFLQPVTLE
jgi:hypothetical protein